MSSDHQSVEFAVRFVYWGKMASVQIWSRVNCFVVHLVIMCLLLKAVDVNTDAVQYTEITTESGKIRGKLNTTLFAGQPFYSYLGIPYAEKPINGLRFKVNVDHTYSHTNNQQHPNLYG